MIRTVLALGALLLTASCTLPGAPAPGVASSVRLQFAPPAGRTVVPDLGAWLSQVDELAVTLTRTDAAAAPLSFPFTGAGVALATQSLAGVPAGTWTVDVTAKKASAVVGSGQTTGVVVTSGATANISVALAPSLASGTGGLSLAVRFPDSAGVSAVVAVLTRRSDGSQPALTVGALSSVAASAPAATQVLLTSASLAAGAYDLDVTFTEPTGTRTYRQAVNIFDGLTSDQTVGTGGVLAPGWFLGNEFFGSSTFLGGLIYSFAGGSFSSPTRDYTFFTNDNTFHLSASNAYFGQSLDYWDEGVAQWTALAWGLNSPEWPVPSTVTLRVSTPTGARGYYTIRVDGYGGAQVTGPAAEPTVEFTTALAGKRTWAFDEALAVTATSATPGSWAWLFDGQVVPGQSGPVFTASAGSLSLVPGAHVLTALFTARGATWARQVTLYFTDVVGDIRLSVQAQRTEVHAGGSTAAAYGDGGLAVTIDDQDLDQLAYGVDTLGSPVTVPVVLGQTTSFTVDTTGLGFGLHTLYLQVKFHDGRLAAAMVPFLVKPRGAVAGLFQISAPPRFHPVVSSSDFFDTFYTLRDLEVDTAIDLGVTIPSLPMGYAASATLVRATLNGQIQDYSSASIVNSQVVVSFSAASLPPGIYALTLELWGGPSPETRQSLGSQTILIYATAGGNV